MTDSTLKLAEGALLQAQKACRVLFTMLSKVTSSRVANLSAGVMVADEVNASIGEARKQIAHALSASPPSTQREEDHSIPLHTKGVPAGGEAEPVAWMVVGELWGQNCSAVFKDKAKADYEATQIGAPEVMPLYTHPPLAKAPLVKTPFSNADAIEAIVACLGDDAAAMLAENDEDERALNMQDAARLIEYMAASPPPAEPHTET